MEISDPEFSAFRRLIYATTGITLGEAKRALVCSRLAKRLRALGLESYSEYYHYLRANDPDGVERQQMINCITTNKTEFFRERHHFEFLAARLFAQWRDRASRGGTRRIRLWSAACSTGEEPYTIAMTLLEHFGPLYGWDIEILATDVDTDVLERAKRGVYSLESIASLGAEKSRKFFLRGTGTRTGTGCIRPELQRLVNFRQLNFVDEPWPIAGPFDAIFCRNVLIYFNRETQQRIVDHLIDRLDGDGHLFLGHSENADWLSRRLVAQGNTIYSVRNGNTGRPVPPAATSRAAVGRPAAMPESPVRLPRTEAPSIAAAAARSDAAPAVRRHIIAGELYASNTPVEICTTLGSCISVCLHDPVARIGGMNHFVLPGETGSRMQAAAYGIHAMELLINQIMNLGGDRRRLRAKLFGGAKVIEISSKSLNVGEQNAEFIRKFCATERIAIDAERLGGTRPLLVRFHTQSGRAFVKALEGRLPNGIEASERRATERLLATGPQCDNNVTLF